MSQVKAADAFRSTTSCLKRQSHRHSWRGLFGVNVGKKKVRFSIEELDENSANTKLKNANEEYDYKRTFALAEDLLCCEEYPVFPSDAFYSMTLNFRPPITNFDTRCQGLVQASKLAYRLHPELPPFVIIARVWREFPIRAHAISFNLTDLRESLFTGRRRREPDKLKWLLLLLNRLLMSDPSYDHEQLLGCLHRVRRLGLSTLGSQIPSYFAFTPAIWSAEDFASSSDAKVISFVSSVSNIYHPDLCESTVEKQYQLLTAKKMRRAMRYNKFPLEGIDGTEMYVRVAPPQDQQSTVSTINGLPVLDSTATTTCPSSDNSDDDDVSISEGRTAWLMPYRAANWLYTVDCEAAMPDVVKPKSLTTVEPPSYLLEGKGFKLQDVRQFKIILNTMRSFFNESIALKLLLDDILDLI